MLQAIKILRIKKSIIYDQYDCLDGINKYGLEIF